MSTTYTPKEIALKFDTDARTVRKFLRSEVGTVGKGQRWAIEAKDMRSLKSKFTKWATAAAEAKAKGTDADEEGDAD